MQKEKLQIVSIFRFGHKKKALFQCPPKGREFILAVFYVVMIALRSLKKIGIWTSFGLFPSPWEGTEKLKPTIKLKVDDGDIAVLPFIFCLF